MRYEIGLFGALGMVLWAAACSSPDVQQGGGGHGGSGGNGGGGATMSLFVDGRVSNDCAPNDGLWFVFTLGTASSCGQTSGLEPQLHVAIYPGNTSMLAADQSWTFDAAMPTGDVQAWWYASGIGGNSEVPKSATVKVVAIAGDMAKVEYAFVAQNGASYAGQMDIDVCSTNPMCG